MLTINPLCVPHVKKYQSRRYKLGQTKNKILLYFHLLYSCLKANARKFIKRCKEKFQMKENLLHLNPIVKKGEWWFWRDGCEMTSIIIINRILSYFDNY